LNQRTLLILGFFDVVLGILVLDFLVIVDVREDVEDEIGILVVREEGSQGILAIILILLIVVFLPLLALFIVNVILPVRTIVITPFVLTISLVILPVTLVILALGTADASVLVVVVVVVVIPALGTARCLVIIVIGLVIQTRAFVDPCSSNIRQDLREDVARGARQDLRAIGSDGDENEWGKCLMSTNDDGRR
jgi:hypothetical protein